MHWLLRMGILCASLLAGTISQATAQDYPTRSVRWLLGFPPGSPTDILVRLMGQYLSERLGQQFIIENRPGAGGNLATQAVIGAPPDGYTILSISHANAINATLFQKLPFHFINDIAPVAGLARVPNVVEVNPSAPDHRGFPMGPSPAIPHSGSGHLVWASIRAASARHGHPRSADCVPIALAKRLR